MAIYVTSDLHGLMLADLQKLLDKAGFGEADWLFILGDVIDRQNDGGVSVLRWLLCQPNAQLLLGNHEAMLLSCDFLFEEITEDSVEAFSEEKMQLWYNYTQNGGDVTLKALGALRETDPEAVEDILAYLREAPLYETVEAGGRHFLLVHAGLENFSPDKKLSEYTADELLWAWLEPDTVYFDGVMTVLGHTPTLAFGREHKGKIMFKPTWIDVDVGVHCGNPPALLRLDDLQEFYL
ncbi:MAG: metallophosphoesterase [Clostridia bacterium]|nr:metallophosphoesterase [Clostridia bacterium]